MNQHKILTEFFSKISSIFGSCEKYLEVVKFMWYLNIFRGSNCFNLFNKIIHNQICPSYCCSFLESRNRGMDVGGSEKPHHEHAPPWSAFPEDLAVQQGTQLHPGQAQGRVRSHGRPQRLDNLVSRPENPEGAAPQTIQCYALDWGFFGLSEFED